MNDLMHAPTVSADHEARMLRSRAASLLAQAETLPEPLATTYRRRARELTVEARLLEFEAAAR